MAAKKAQEAISISPPDMRHIELDIEGIAPLVINRMSQKSINKMRATQEAGSTAKGKKVREPRDFEEDFKGAQYVSEEGWNGIHAGAFRNGAIGACRTVGFVMTHAKLGIFIEADGFDNIDGTPLVRIISDDPPEMNVMPAKNDNGGTDLRSRPMWRRWGAKLRIRFDGGMFTTSDIVNLFSRVGLQGGICEGRPSSKKSAGLGWGLFKIVNA